MYEKVVNYFESNLCLENIYFRKKHKLWVIGIVMVVLIELMINYTITKKISNILIEVSIILIIDLVCTSLFFILAYILPIIKIYKEKIKGKTKIDIIGLLMKEERLSAYREIEIEKMEKFLRKNCKIKNTGSIDTIIDMINEEIKNKYTKDNFMDKYFNSTILPILILVLTIYFTNANEQNFTNILSKTAVFVLPIIFTGNFVTKLKNINITPVSKKENLLELKRVLMDIKIKMENK